MQINLSHKNLIDFDPTAFSTDEEREVLRSITKLDISHNSISSLQGLVWLSTLTSLDISNNNIASLRGLPLPLRQLNASFNMLTDVEGLLPLLHLKVLLVSHNQITNLEGLPASVRIVDASSNRLSLLTGIEKCIALKELHLQRNMIQNIDSLAPIKSLYSLKALTLAENPLTSSKRRVTALREILPQNLEIVDLPFTSGGVYSSTTPSSYTAASCNATTMQRRTSSCSSSSGTVKITGGVSTHGSPSNIPLSSPQMLLHETNCHETREELLRENETTSLVAENDPHATRPSSFLQNNIPDLPDTGHSHILSDSRDPSIIHASHEQIPSVVDLPVCSISAHQLFQSMVEKLQSELEEYKKTYQQSRNLSNGRPEKEVLENDPYSSHAEEQSGETFSLEERAELRHGARSLAALFMSLVPKSTMMESSHSRSSCSTTSHRHTTSNNTSNTDGNNSLRNYSTNDKGSKRSVSFGGFAYYSPPSW